jgi:translocation protein SEC66
LFVFTIRIKLQVKYFNLSKVLNIKFNLAASKVKPWFDNWKSREIYISLLQTESPDEYLLKAALLRRAMTVVTRVLQMREQRPPLSKLLKQGSIGEDVWNSFQKAEEELEQEVMEVVQEADTFNQGWGKSIYQTASEMIAHEKLRTTQINFERLRAAERDVNAQRAVWKKELDQAQLAMKEKISAATAKELIDEENQARKRK